MGRNRSLFDGIYALETAYIRIWGLYSNSHYFYMIIDDAAYVGTE